MIRYKINVMEELKKNGYNPSKIKREKLLSGQTITDLTNGKMIAITSIGKVCVMLHYRIGNYRRREDKIFLRPPCQFKKGEKL